MRLLIIKSILTENDQNSESDSANLTDYIDGLISNMLRSYR